MLFVIHIRFSLCYLYIISWQSFLHTIIIHWWFLIWERYLTLRVQLQMTLGDDFSEFLFISGAQHIINYLKRGSLLQPCVRFEKLKKTYSSSLPSPFFLYHWKLTIDNGGWMYLYDLYIIVFFLDSCYRGGF